MTIPPEADKEALRMELQEAITTFRVQINLLVQIAGVLATADALLLGYGFAQRQSAIFIVASLLPVVLMVIGLEFTVYVLPILYVAIKIEEELGLRTAPLVTSFRDALVASLDPESSHLVTVSFPIVQRVQICRVDVERSPHPVFLVGKNIPQQFYIRDEGAPPQPIRCPSCGELIQPPEFYVRKGNASRPLDVRRAHEYIRDHWG